jgi:type IV secretion system protein VirB10
LSHGFGFFGAVVGRTVDSPLEKAAKDMLDRAPVVTLGQGQEIAFVLRGALECKDARK